MIAAGTMKSEILNEEMLRRYLLDDASDEERAAVEERFLQDDSVFEEMLALEDELHYDYRQGRLSGRERSVFEQKFVQTPKEQEKSNFAGAFLQATGALAGEQTAIPNKVFEKSPTSWRQKIAAFFSFKSLQYGMAAAAIFLTLGLFFLAYQNRRLQNEVAQLENKRTEEQRRQEQTISEKQQQQAQLETRLAEEKSQGAENEKRIQELKSERARLEREIAAARRHSDRPVQNPVPQTPGNSAAASSRSIVALILSPGLFTRDGGDAMKRVTLSPAAKSLQIRLLLKNEDYYQSYRAVLKTLDDGNEIWKSEKLKAPGKNANKSFSISIPAMILRRADYELSLIGVTPGGQTEEITIYYFSVLK